MKDIDDIQKAIKYVTSIRNESCVVLDNFKKKLKLIKILKQPIIPWFTTIVLPIVIPYLS